MIKLTLKASLLMTFTLAAGLSSIVHAQQSTTTAAQASCLLSWNFTSDYCKRDACAPVQTSLAGEWVGNSEPAGRVEFLHLSLTENAGELVSPLKAKLLDQ